MRAHRLQDLSVAQALGSQARQEETFFEGSLAAF